MSYKLYTYPNNYRAQKALIAAQYAGVEIEVPTFNMGVDNKTEAFRAKFPLGKVPAFETPQGPLYESNAIARYVARLRADSGLLGSSFFESALVDQWVDWSANELEAPRGVWYYTVVGYLAFNAKAVAEAKKDVINSLKVLDSHFLHNTYLVGNQVTLADLSVFTALVDVFGKLVGPDTVKSVPNLIRWFNTIANQTEVAAVIKKVEFAKEEAAVAKGGKAEKKEEKKKEEKPKEAAKPAPAPAAEAFDEEDLQPKKQKSALDDLPPSNMVLDAMKKLAFSERPFKKTFFSEFWPQFDAAGYTWYIASYNYNNENTVFFRVGNAVGGFLQRCDAVRKYAMGVMNITGSSDEDSNGPWDIEGAFLFRGPEVPKVEMLGENPDSEYYTWKKVDVSTEEGRKQIENQFIAEKIHNKDVVDRRYFK